MAYKSTGRKARNNNRPYKLGRVKYNSWASEVLKVLDIVVYDMELAHIINRHPIELIRIKMNALEFLKYIVSNYNEIRTGSNGSVLLVVRKKDLSEWAAIELVPNVVNKEEYKIKTASLIKDSQLLKKKLLCAGGHRFVKSNLSGK